jgi:hypothetical protein
VLASRASASGNVAARLRLHPSTTLAHFFDQSGVDRIHKSDFL